MSSRSRVVALALLVLGAAVLAWLTIAPRKSAWLVDGTKVSVRSIYFGKDDGWNPGTTPQRLARQFLPRKVLNRVGLAPLNRIYKDDFLFICIQFEGTPPARPFALSITDEKGLESVRFYNDRMFAGGSNDQHLVSFKFANVPMHSEVLQLNLFETASTGVTQVVTLRAKNPAFTQKRFPAAPPLPQTVRERGVDFMLLAVNTGLYGTGSVTLALSPWTEFVFRIGTNEPAALGTNERAHGSWTIKAVSATSLAGIRHDDTHLLGRVGWQRGEAHMSRLDDGVVNLRGSLWPEIPWKIHAEFAPTGWADLQPEEFVMFNGVPLPPPGQTNALKLSTEVLNTTVRMLSIGARELRANSASTSNRVIVSVNMNFSGKGAQSMHVRRVTDNRGKEAVSSPRRVMPGTPVTFQVDPGVTSLDFILGVERIYAVDFVAQPTVLRTNVAHW